MKIHALTAKDFWKAIGIGVVTAVLLSAIMLPAFKLGMLPDKGTEIVVYCGNAPCKRSDRAAERLLDMGYPNVRDYHEGKDDWIEAGLPIEYGGASHVA